MTIPGATLERTSVADGEAPTRRSTSVGRSVLRDDMQTSAGRLGEAAWIASARIHGTRRIRQKQCELRDHGNLDGRRLEKALGERSEGFTLLEHHPMPDHEEGRLPVADARRPPGASRARPRPFVAPTASRVARREASARGRSTDRPLARVQRQAGYAAGERGCWPTGGPRRSAAVARSRRWKRHGAWRQERAEVRSSASTARRASSPRRAARRTAPAASCRVANAAAIRSWEGGGEAGQVAAAR